MIIGNGQRGVQRIGPNQGDTARTSVGMRSSLDKRFLVIYPEDSLYHSQLQQSRVSLCMCHRYISSSTPFSRRRRRSPMRATWMAGRLHTPSAELWGCAQCSPSRLGKLYVVSVCYRTPTTTNGSGFLVCRQPAGKVLSATPACLCPV